jgi:hypothetical protein
MMRRACCAPVSHGSSYPGSYPVQDASPFIPTHPAAYRTTPQATPQGILPNSARLTETGQSWATPAPSSRLRLLGSVRLTISLPDASQLSAPCSEPADVCSCRSLVDIKHTIRRVRSGRFSQRSGPESGSLTAHEHRIVQTKPKEIHPRADANSTIICNTLCRCLRAVARSTPCVQTLYPHRSMQSWPRRCGTASSTIEQFYRATIPLEDRSLE